MLITLISDPHIAPPGEHPFGVDTRGLFTGALEFQSREKSDLLIITGDLSYRDGDESSYKWIKKQLDDNQTPYRIIGGNHDDSSVLARTFALEDHLHNSIELYYEEKIPGHHLIYLDSSVGSLSKLQWSWLEEKLTSERELKKLIFMHHPPTEAAAPYMDKNHAFREIDKFRKLVKKSECRPTVFCGHYHIEKSLILPEMDVFICPSTFFNLDDKYRDFKVLNNRSCYRRVELSEEMLRTSVYYQ